MLIAILIYAIYSNLISVSQAWVAQGRVSFWIGVWAVHTMMLLPAAFLFYQRSDAYALAAEDALMLLYRRYLMREVLAAVLLVLAAFIALFSFLI